MKPHALSIATLSLLLATGGCGRSLRPANAPTDLGRVRSDARGSTDGETVGRWLLDEMLTPGGSATSAAEARTQLDKAKDKGLWAGLAQGMFDETHGRPQTAAQGYVAALVAAREAEDPATPLAAWYATHHLVGLHGSVRELWKTNERQLTAVMNSPGALGWRALAELHEWSAAEAFDKAEVTGDKYDALVVGRMGCAKSLRIAGPFGRGTSPERRKSFAAERSPWLSTWPEEPTRGTVPHVLKTERHRCMTASTEKVDEGVFYVETFFDSKGERDLLVAAQGSIALWVDDVPVVERDLRQWGIWERFGGAVHVGKGRHRVLARVLSDAGSIRLLNLDGSSAGLETDSDDKKPYGLARASVLPDPNPIHEIVLAAQADPPVAQPPLIAALAAHAAHVDGMDDVASALLEPHTSPKDAAPVALLMAAQVARTDAAFPEQVRRIREKDLFDRAAKGDLRLWYARAWVILDDADSRGLVEAVEPLRTLAQEVPGVPDVTEQLARVYGKLGWHAERMRVVRDLVARFPDERDALTLCLGALEEDGSLAEADKIASRIKKLDPDSEVDLDRALARRDWKAAIAELRRLGKRRPDRKEIPARIAEVLMRAGDPSAAVEQLEKALAKAPEDTHARFRIADYEYAKGDTTALRRALAEAIQAGAKANEIRDAVELIEGASLLEPYRQDGRTVIREFSAWEKRGKRMDGNAARILDYAAVWVHPDGSSEMLEHEIQKMQSQEAVDHESEQKPPDGLVLRLRVIKADGSVLEPEPVSGKPTLTMPHLEVGDYIEMEHVTAFPSEGGKGKRYRGPHWFFREADKGYWRSEFVVLTPKDRALEIEQVGKVPDPKLKEIGPFVERRWRVDESPPAPEEPDAPSPREFLPSVRIGWGIDLPSILVRYVDAASEETPLDPRVRKIAREIVKDVPVADREARARALYKFVGDSVQDGQDTDGRRVITGRSGSRQSAFVYLLRELGIPVELAIVKSRIAPPPVGKMSEVEEFDNVTLRIDTGKKGPTWMTVRDKFAPFGYVPAELRGQPAIRLVPGTPKDTTPTLGAADGVKIAGRASMKEDGSATVELTESYSGRIGMGLRAVFDRVAETKRKELVETKLLASNIPGARLEKLEIANKEDLAAPLVLKMTARVPQLARPAGGKLLLKPLFSVDIAQMASLAQRQTPLLLASSTHVEVDFQVVVPTSMRPSPGIPTGKLKDGDRTVTVSDAEEGNVLTMRRVVDIPAGRVQPGAEYARFVAFTQSADQLLSREIAIGQ